MKKWKVASLMFIAWSGVVLADCDDWNSFPSDEKVEYRWCQGKFEYKGGEYQLNIHFRNNGARTVKIECTVDVIKSDGSTQKSSFYATVRPDEINRDGGNFTIGKTTKNGNCKIKYQ